MQVKSKRISFIIILIITLVFIGFSIEKSRQREEYYFQKFKEKANEFLSQDIDIEARENFERALDIKLDDDVISSLFNLYLRQDDDSKAIELISKSNESYRLNKLLLDYYYNSQRYKDLNNRLKDISQSHSDLYNSYSKKIEAEYIYLGDVYDQVNYSPKYSSGFSVKKGDKWGIINNKGNYILGLNYDWIGLYTEVEAYYPVEIKGEYFFIDKNKNIRSKVASNLNRPFSMDGYIYTTEDRQSYINNLGKFILKNQEDLTNFNDGYALIKNKETWTLQDNQLKSCNIKFPDIKRDGHNNFIFQNKIIGQLESGKYRFFSMEKKDFIGDSYDHISFDYSGEAFAVKEGSEWKFIGLNKEINLLDDLEYVESFTKGLAVIKKGLYGLINRDGHLVWPIKYEKIYPFNKDGISFVKEEGQWRMIQLIKEI